MKSILAIVTLLFTTALISAQQEHPSFVPAAPPQVLEFVTRTDGWNYPQGDTDIIKLTKAFKLTPDTKFYLEGKEVQPKDICIPCGDVIQRFKLDDIRKNFTDIDFKHTVQSLDFKLGGK